MHDFLLSSNLLKQNETAILINDAGGPFTWALDRAWPALRPAFCVIELPAKFILMFPGGQRFRRVSIALRHSHGEFTDFCLVVAC